MTYVALLRGINVGGNNKVEMAKLKQTFERMGYSHVKTFINSGNVIFRADHGDTDALAKVIEAAIEKDFGFPVATLVKNLDEMAAITDTLPKNWTTDKEMRSYVLFLWPEIDKSEILEQIPHNPDIEDMLYAPGAALHRIDRANATRGKMIQVIGTDLNKKITMRNSNSVRKIYDLMLAADGSD